MGNYLELDDLGIAVVAIGVRDLDKAVEYYESCGIGPFEPEAAFDTSVHPEYKIYGKTPASPFKGRMRFNRAGPIMLELCEPLEAGHFHEEFLVKHGGGVEHIAYFVDDLAKEKAKLVEKGFPVVLSATTKSGGTYAYFDTTKFGNFYIELIQMSEEDRLREEEAKKNREEKGKTGNIWELHHLGITVRELGKAVEYYESCGIGPWGPEGSMDTSGSPEYRVYGKPLDSPFKAKTRSNTAGPIKLVIGGDLEGGGHIHKEFLEKHGEGVDHLAYVVDDLDKETDELVAKGFPVLVSNTTGSGSRYAYFDTRKFGHLCLELIQMSEEDRIREGRA